MRTRLKIPFQRDPFTLDPQQCGDSISFSLVFLLLRGLTRFGTDQNISCDIASSYHMENNYKKYVFYLGEHFWSDGSPITAHDFVNSWKRVLLPNFPVKMLHLFFHIKNAKKAWEGHCPLDKVGVYAQNDSTLVVELEYPCPYFLELTSFSSFFAYRDDSVWSGPFRLGKWKEGKEIFLEKNPSYHLPLHIEGIDIKIIGDEKEAFSLFEKGELDWIGDPICPLPIDYLPDLLFRKKIKPVTSLVSCWFNTLQPPFNDINLRKGIAHAISRQKLLEKLSLPGTLLANSIFPSAALSSSDHPIEESKELAETLYKTALQKSKTKKARITLSYETTDEFSRVAKVIQSSLESCLNISVELEPLPFKEFWQRIPARSFEMALFCARSQYTDLINFLERFESKDLSRNFSGWENRKFQSLLKQYRNSSDKQTQIDLATKAQALLLGEMPVVPLYHNHFAYLQKSYVKNLSISPLGTMQFDRISLEEPASSGFLEELKARK